MGWHTATILQHGIHLGQEAEMLTDGLRALLLESLSAARFITPKWPHVAGPENVVRLPCPQSVTALLVECNAAQRAAADVTPCPQSLPSQ